MANQLRAKDGAIISRGRAVGWAYWYPETVGFWKRPIVRTGAAMVLLAPCWAFLSQFAQLRGYVNITASRVDLVIATILLLVMEWVFSLNLSRWRKTVGWGLTLITACCALAVDYSPAEASAVSSNIYPAERSDSNNFAAGTVRQRGDWRKSDWHQRSLSGTAIRRMGVLTSLVLCLLTPRRRFTLFCSSQ